MLIHASCAARHGSGVLLTGAPGSGKSDLLLRLLDRGFALVADDQVEVIDGVASAPPSLAGLLEIRGLGIVRLPYERSVPLALVAAIGRDDRLPTPKRHDLGPPLIMIDPALASAPIRVGLSLACALGPVAQIAGAFLPC